MKSNLPAKTAPIQFFEQTMEITSRMMVRPGKTPLLAALGSGHEPALADMVFEHYAAP